MKKGKIFTGRSYKMRKRSSMHDVSEEQISIENKVLQTTIKFCSMKRTVHVSMALTDFMEPGKSTHFQKSHEIYPFHLNPHKIRIFPLEPP